MFALSRNNDEQLRKMEHELADKRRQLEEAKARIGRLEEALTAACDYAEQCAHFPGRDLLRERHEIL